MIRIAELRKICVYIELDENPAFTGGKKVVKTKKNEDR